MTTYSHTRLSSFEKCRHSYASRYVLKDYPFKRTSIEALVGKLVHSVIEDLHRGFVQLSKIAAWTKFGELWDEKYHPDLAADVRGHGAQWWQDHGLRCLSNYLKSGQPPADCDVLAIENKYKAQLTLEPATEIVGIVDRLIVGPDGYEIHDFKTGKKPARKWFERDHQLPLYAQLIETPFMIEPEESITVKRLYLATGEIEPYVVTRERRLEAWNWAQTTARKAHAFEEAFRAGDAEAAPNVSRLCDWCALKSAGCPAHTKVEDIL